MGTVYKGLGDDMERILTRFYFEEQGAGLVEYTLIMALVALACATVLTGLGTKIGTILTSITTTL